MHAFEEDLCFEKQENTVKHYQHGTVPLSRRCYVFDRSLCRRNVLWCIHIRLIETALKGFVCYVFRCLRTAEAKERSLRRTPLRCHRLHGERIKHMGAFERDTCFYRVFVARNIHHRFCEERKSGRRIMCWGSNVIGRATKGSNSRKYR